MPTVYLGLSEITFIPKASKRNFARWNKIALGPRIHKSKWILHNYFLNKLKKVWIQLRRGVLDTTLCDKVCHWHAAGQWFSLGTTVSSTNKTNCHNISEILLKVALNTITLTITHYEVLLKKIIEHTVLKRERERKKKRVQFVPTKLDLLLRNNILNI